MGRLFIDVLVAGWWLVVLFVRIVAVITLRMIAAGRQTQDE